MSDALFVSFSAAGAIDLTVHFFSNDDVHAWLSLYFVWCIFASGEIVASLVKYSAPDAVVDFEWHEMGDWHSLCLSLSSGGVSCSIDGVARKVLYWTALGYVDVDEAPPNIRYPDLAPHQVLQVSGAEFNNNSFAISIGSIHIFCFPCLHSPYWEVSYTSSTRTWTACRA